MVSQAFWKLITFHYILKQVPIYISCPGERCDTRCVSVQGLHPSKDPAFAVSKGESFGETLLTASTIVKWDGLAFGSFPGLRHQMFYPCVMISAAHAQSTPRDVTIFSLSFFFFGRTKNLGICKATKDGSCASSKKREKKVAFVRCLWSGLQMQPLKDADPEVRHNSCVALALQKHLVDYETSSNFP